MIEACDVLEIKPSWQRCAGDRYIAHPSLRTAFVQVMSDPKTIYVITDQKLPSNVREAISMVEQWRADHEATEI
jgi:hypothetical protein